MKHFREIKILMEHKYVIASVLSIALFSKGDGILLESLSNTQQENV
jgi:hypothetical protein